MNYQIMWDKKAREFLRKIDKSNAQRIIKKINSIIDDPEHYLEILVDIVSFKLRIGDYRALIDIDEDKRIIAVVFIGHRKDIYKYVKRTGFMVKK